MINDENMTDEELFAFLHKQEEELRKKPTFFLHYDASTKAIVNFRNYLDKTDSNPYVELKEEEMDVPLSEFNISDYKVSLKDKVLKLEKVKENEIIITKIDDFIYEIPRIFSKKRITYNDHPYDLMIEQNNPLKEFKIKLSKNLREKYENQSTNHQYMYVYVTAVNDPNILYKTLKFTFNDLIVNEYYTIEFNDFDGSRANIYSFKYFQDYLHVDIRNDG